GEIFQGPGGTTPYRLAQNNRGQPCLPPIHPENPERDPGRAGGAPGGPWGALWGLLSGTPAPTEGLPGCPLPGGGFPGDQPIGPRGDFPAHAHGTGGWTDRLDHRPCP